jgi:hypothetical protein
MGETFTHAITLKQTKTRITKWQEVKPVRILEKRRQRPSQDQQELAFNSPWDVFTGT